MIMKNLTTEEKKKIINRLRRSTTFAEVVKTNIEVSNKRWDIDLASEINDLDMVINLNNQVMQLLINN